jgi:hypothetical protein
MRTMVRVKPIKGRTMVRVKPIKGRRKSQRKSQRKREYLSTLSIKRRTLKKIVNFSHHFSTTSTMLLRIGKRRNKVSRRKRKKGRRQKQGRERERRKIAGSK